MASYWLESRSKGFVLSFAKRLSGNASVQRARAGLSDNGNRGYLGGDRSTTVPQKAWGRSPHTAMTLQASQVTGFRGGPELDLDWKA